MKMHAPPFILKEIKIEVTHQCDLMCIHCSSHAGYGNHAQMLWDDCERILNEAGNVGVNEVAFSGGEPLSWQHIIEAVNVAKRNNLFVAIYTTGITQNYEYILDEAIANGLDRIIFSVYGGNDIIHDTITGSKGSFEETISAIRYACLKGLQVEFHFVPMQHNYNQLQQIVAIADHVGVRRVSVLRLVPQGRCANANLLLSHQNNIALREEILKIRSTGKDIRLGSPYNIFMLNDNPTCSAAIDRLTISPDLYIYPCDAFKQIKPEHIGIIDPYHNIKNNSLRSSWEQSKYFNAIREYLTTPFASSCASCNAIPRCLSGCVAQKIHSSGSLIKAPDPMCMMRASKAISKINLYSSRRS